MKMNSPMFAVLERGAVDPGRNLSPELDEVARAGWVLGPCGAILLKSLWGPGWRTSIDASEVGSYEYEVNDVYVSLSDLAANKGTYLNRAAVRGISFAARMLRDATALPEADSLLAVVSISVDEGDEDFLLQGATVRFFSRRGEYPTWFEDLERYQKEAVAIVDMADLAVPDPLTQFRRRA
ncbi:hypothetical protein [Micromonospora sp. NPDC048063]|uniref:hypothetical protein n=1 Tax=Micromonospora sp. NPDC048063 TaxID=3364256 RepID=UPI003717C427